MAQNNTTKLKQLRESNAERNGALMAQGVSIHPLSLIQAQLHAVVEFLGLQCELKLEQEIEQLLDQAEQELARAKLTAGLSLPNFKEDK